MNSPQIVLWGLLSAAFVATVVLATWLARERRRLLRVVSALSHENNRLHAENGRNMGSARRALCEAGLGGVLIPGWEEDRREDLASIDAGLRAACGDERECVIPPPTRHERFHAMIATAMLAGRDRLPALEV